MELDDLRRQWQQAPEPVAAPVGLSAAELTRLLAQQSGSVVARLRRNARLEVGLNYSLLAAALVAAGWAPALWVRLFAGLLALVALVCIYYFHRKLGLLRSMDDPADDLRGHLVRLTTGLRALIRFYYRFTLAMVPVTLLASLAVELLAPAGQVVKPFSWSKTAGVVGAEAVLGLGLYWGAGRVTAWYLQRLYGQHLDRLESQLRELSEGDSTD